MNNFIIKRLKIIILGSLVMLSTGCALTMDDYNAAVVQTLVGEKGNIVATGYAVISVQPHDNPAQQRLLSIRASKLDAYR